ncbi:putative Calcium/calmodulin-dependent protein kinase kinase 2 [Blattamonas nauphoetae]|uniref:Calcium/calmodulin-dependent protein kinase kinase 2 n=1 Tax=Blattamonas nauphoetae TaxID=2049346 RepID=A0ABQ9XEH6_9EUKA|nr:putative Calcium/calmodulin-dependent protein kinase kinase 2 [Blattamonas nauphoetae]
MCLVPPKHPLLYEISTRPWLYQLSVKYKQDISKLSQVPDSEIKSIAEQGYNIVWMMGLWQLGPLGRQLDLADAEKRRQFDENLPGWTEDDAIGSPYAISWYRLNPSLGTNADLQAFRQRLNSFGLLMMVDLVPNHCSQDSPLVSMNREMFIHTIPSDKKPYDSNYYREDGIAYGRDPYSGAWKDTAQYNIWNAQMQNQLMQFLRTCSQLSDGVRCDMAMLLVNSVVEKTWSYQQQMNGYKSPSIEFWKMATTTIKREHPHFLFMAEVYWGMERELLGYGFDYVYDKDGLYNTLVTFHMDNIRGYVKQNDLSQFAHFTENHDENRAIAEFGGVEQANAAAVISFTLPGLRFVNQGQEDGKANRLHVHLRRSADEPVKPTVQEFYNKLLKCLTHDVFHNGKWEYITLESKDSTEWRMMAWKWKLGKEKRLCIINFTNEEARGIIKLGDAAEKSLDGKTVTLTDEIGDQPNNGMASLTPRETDGGESHVVDTHEAQRRVNHKTGQEFINQYEIGGKLGQGAYGLVVKGENSENRSQKVAIKMLNKAQLIAKSGKAGAADSVLNALKREIAIMKKLDHPNVVKLYEVIDDPNSTTLYLVMEYLPGGPCFKSGRGALGERQCKYYLRDIVQGIEYCHFNEIVHHDIKPDNILIGADKKLKLCDFGVSTLCPNNDDTTKALMGTPAFMAPEIVQRKKAYAGRPVDLWAVGVTMYLCAYGKYPFQGPNTELLYKAIQTEKPPFPDTVGKDCRRVIRKLLEKDPKKRMTIEQLKTDPWLTSNGSFVFPTPYRVEVSEEEMDNAVTAFKPLQAMIGLKIMMSRKANEARQRVRNNTEAMTARTSATAQTSVTETDFEENKQEANEDGSETLELGLVEDEKLVRADQSNQPSVEQQSDISTNMVSQTGHESANRESPTPSVAESWSVPLSPHLPHKTSQIGESYALPLNEMESTRRAEEERMKKDREEAQLRAKKMMDKSDECCVLF